MLFSNLLLEDGIWQLLLRKRNAYKLGNGLVNHVKIIKLGFMHIILKAEKQNIALKKV